MSDTTFTFTFEKEALGLFKHGQPLRQLKKIRSDTNATFIINLKEVDAEGKLTVKWKGSKSECREARKRMVQCVRGYNKSKKHNNTSIEAVEVTAKSRPASTLHRVANVAPELQNYWNKVRKAPPAIKGLNTKRPRSPEPVLTMENFPALVSSSSNMGFGNYTDPYSDIPDYWTDEDYKNVETYLDDFTAEGWKHVDCVEGECEEQLLEAEIAGTECDPAPESPFIVAVDYPEESVYDERGNLISLYHNYSRRVSWSPNLSTMVY
jgi:hypothetical protein